MPWEIEKRDDEWCVIKVEDGEVEGCHDTEEAAQAQLAALNIAESEMDESGNDSVATETKEESISQFVDRVYDQFMSMFEMRDDEGYIGGPWVKEVYNTYVIACDGDGMYRVNYMDTESGNVIFEDRNNWTEVEVSYVDKAATLLKHFEKEADDPPKPNLTWRDKLKSAAKTVLDFLADDGGSDDKSVLAGLDLSQPYGVAVKTVNGEPWHLTWSTNSFEDRENEIFSIKALEDFVSESEKTGFKGTFDFWHIPGTEFAVKEWKAIIGRFLVEAGPYMDSEQGRRAKTFFKQYSDYHPEIAPEGWGASPEFRFLPEDRADGVYDWLWITKTSTLPKSAAANIWTKGSQQEMNEQQKKAAIKIFGEEFVNNLETQAVKETEDLEAAGVNHKSNDDGDSAKPEPTALDMDELAKALSEQFSVNLDPLTEMVKEIGTQLTAVTKRVETLEKTEKAKSDNEVPRFMFNLVKRATESEDTQLKDNDPLKDKKPAEKQAPQSTVASAFFSK